jgi:RHS repeat-associated protein
MAMPLRSRSVSVHECDAGEFPTPTGCKPGPVAGQCRPTTLNPIEIATGRKLKTFVDWSSGGAHPLQFARFYSSDFSAAGILNPAVGVNIEPAYSRFGRGWRSNFDTRAAFKPPLGGSTDPAQPSDGSLVFVVMPDSTEYAFRYISAQSKWVPVRPTGTQSWTQQRTDVDASFTAANSEFKLTVPGGTVFKYDFSGNLRVIRNLDGYALTLAYSDSRNTSVSDSFGRTLKFEYFDDESLDGFLKSMTTPDGKTFAYSYVSRVISPPGVPSGDIAHREYALEKVVYPDATPGNPADNPTLSFQYLNDYQFPYALTGIIDERGVEIGTYAYDTKGRATSSQGPAGADLTTLVFDDVNHKVTVTNPLTRQTAYTFDDTQQFNRRLTQIDGIATANCAATNTAYAYDTNGFRSQESATQSLDARFPGQWFQIETGLAYNWHRHYDPTTGRYTQPDRLRFIDGPSRYAYVANSPQMDIDPEGLRQLRPSPIRPPYPQPPNPLPFSPKPEGHDSPLSDLGGWLGEIWNMCFRLDNAGNKVSPTAASLKGTSGDCEPERHQNLQAMVDHACGQPRSCRAGMSKAELLTRAETNRRCGMARDRLNKKCFRGGDTGHRNQANDAWRNVAKCELFLFE